MKTTTKHLKFTKLAKIFEFWKSTQPAIFIKPVIVWRPPTSPMQEFFFFWKKCFTEITEISWVLQLLHVLTLRFLKCNPLLAIPLWIIFKNKTSWMLWYNSSPKTNTLLVKRIFKEKDFLRCNFLSMIRKKKQLFCRVFLMYYFELSVFSFYFQFTREKIRMISSIKGEIFAKMIKYGPKLHVCIALVIS